MPYQPSNLQLLFYVLKLIVEIVVLIGFFVLVPKGIVTYLFGTAVLITYAYWVYDMVVNEGD